MEFVIENIYHTILYFCLYFNVCLVTSWFVVRGSREKEKMGFENVEHTSTTL